MENCESCGQRVFLMERLGVENRVFHRTCFKCCTCHCKLKAGSYEYDALSDKFYCRQHYREALRSQTITRAMAEKGLVQPPKEAKKTKTASKESPSQLQPLTRPSPPRPYTGPPVRALSSDNSAVANGSMPPTSVQTPPTNGGSPIPSKPPRRKKHVTSTESVSGDQNRAGEESEASQPEAKGVNRASIRPKRVAPPRPSHPPSLRNRPSSPAMEQARRRRVRLGQLRQELAKLENTQSSVETRGVEIERQLRGKDDIDEDDTLMMEWFEMVQEKTKLVRRESELVYELRDLELIEQHDQLEAEIRKRLAKDSTKKSERELVEEDAMVNELVVLVEKRNKLVWDLHEEKQMEEQEEHKDCKDTKKDFFHLQRSKTTHL